MKQNKYRYIMMLGHLFTDINQGALPALLPFIMVARGLNYASVTSLMFASTLMSSIVQPIFGYIGDKKSRPWLMCVGVVVAGSGISLIGFLPEYWMMFCAAMVTGIGVALFHPEGGRLANIVSGDKKGAGMSIFAVGGNIGFSVGPLFVALAMKLFGIRGTGLLIIPAITMATIIFISLRKIQENEQQARSAAAASGAVTDERDDWPSFIRVALVVFSRSIIATGMSTFIPLYWVGVLNQPEEVASLALTVYSITAAAATLIGGRLADKFGFRRVVRASVVAFVPCFALMLLTRSPVIALVMLVPIALSFGLPFSTLIVLGQSMLPNRVGLASGITMGLGVSVGGVVAPLLGSIGDNYGLTTTMWTISGISVAVVLFAFLLRARRTEQIAA